MIKISDDFFDGKISVMIQYFGWLRDFAPPLLNNGLYCVKKICLVVCLCSAISIGDSQAAQSCNSQIPQSTPTEDFIDHGDGTVTHKSTGLMWKRCEEGLSGLSCAIGTRISKDFPSALEYATTNNSYAGYNDWRLPNIKELASIVEVSCEDPSLNLTFFPNSRADYFWSSSPASGTSAWRIRFAVGGSVYSAGKNYTYQIRLVRGGD